MMNLSELIKFELGTAPEDARVHNLSPDFNPT